MARHISTLIKQMLRWLHDNMQRWRRMNHRFVGAVHTMSGCLRGLSMIASVLLLGALVVYFGFDHSADEVVIIRRVIRAAQLIFLTDIFYGFIFDPHSTFRQRGIVKKIVDAAIVVTLLPLIYPQPVHPWLPWLERLLYSFRFLTGVLTAYAIVDVSYAVMMLVGRRTNPSLLLSSSFLAVIFIGSLPLMLPKCTYGPIQYVDALFVSTSAVCITGLSTIDVYVNFTPLGMIVLAVLIQIGGLGLMTFTSFFALFFSGRTSIYSHLVLRDMIYSKSMSNLFPTLLYILSFSLIVELIGAVVVYGTIEEAFGLPFLPTVAISFFHSLSSFCNAGFCVMPGGMSNPLLLYGGGSIYWITSVIVIAGAIGFPILVNFKDALMLHLRRFWLLVTMRRDTEPRNVHPFDMNTKIVLTTFFILFFGGAVLFGLLEWNNSLAGFSAGDKITQSVFNSVTPRSAGFASVNPAGFLNVTLIMVMFLMWVGGGSQSTAGGIKVNTFAAICLNLRCIILGRDKVTAFRRTIAVWSIRRANAVVCISIISYLLYSMTILALEPALPTRDLLFETLSALFTIGSSLGVTPLLSPASKLILCSAMFLGRVGLVSLMSGLAGRRHDSPVSYPTDNLIIN
ncbi:MAG: potassium transporter [Paramuribaculum sp.]|nr:potassium transporter [Paramuribaculum sp.]